MLTRMDKDCQLHMVRKMHKAVDNISLCLISYFDYLCYWAYNEGMKVEKVFLKKRLNLKKYPLEHVGHMAKECTDTYEMIIPLGNDYCATLLVDTEAVKESGYFGELKEQDE